MFRNVPPGIQCAITVHVQTLDKSTTNDRIRSLFKDLLFNDLDMAEKIFRYGKTKNWLHPVPRYEIIRS